MEPRLHLDMSESCEREKLGFSREDAHIIGTQMAAGIITVRWSWEH